MIYLLSFLAAGAASLILIGLSNLEFRTKVLAVAVVTFFVAVAFWAGAVWYSPFATGDKAAFGQVEDSINLVAALVGIMAGIVGSVYFKADTKIKLTVRAFLKPLCCAPLTIIPILKLIEGTDQITVLGVATLLFTSYQAGFFWERFLRASK